MVTPSKKQKGGNSRPGPKKSTPTKKVKNQKEKTVSPESVVPRSRVENAVGQLSKFLSTAKKQEDGGKPQLFADDADELAPSLHLIAVNNRSFTGSAKSFKPKLVSIKHSIYRPWKENSATAVKDFKVLLIVKDADKQHVSQDDLHDHLDGIVIDEVVCGKDLKTVYKAYEARRAFVSQFSLVLADDGIITTLPKLLGGKAYTKLETTPIPIKTSANNKLSLVTLCNSIKKIYHSRLPFRLPRGTTLNMHMGQLTWFSQTDLCDNLIDVIEYLVKTYKIRSIFIKTNVSPALPLYDNKDVLDELVESQQMQKKAEANPANVLEIDGVKVQLSAFDRALAEIADPKTLGTIFAPQLERAKKRQIVTDEKEDKKVSKKAKKAK